MRTYEEVLAVMQRKPNEGAIGDGKDALIAQAQRYG